MIIFTILIDILEFFVVLDEYNNKNKFGGVHMVTVWYKIANNNKQTELRLRQSSLAHAHALFKCQYPNVKYKIKYISKEMSSQDCQKSNLYIE